MGLYSILIKPWVRNANIEKASRVALRYFELIEKIPGGRTISRWIHNNRPVGLQREVFGLQFYNPIGLASGLDIYGELYNDLNNLGFSFVEVGPMDAKRVRRAVRRIQDDPQNDITAACINADYLTAFTLAYDFFDFFVIDIQGGDEAALLRESAVVVAQKRTAAEGDDGRISVAKRLRFHVAERRLAALREILRDRHADALDDFVIQIDRSNAEIPRQALRQRGFA